MGDDDATKPPAHERDKTGAHTAALRSSQINADKEVRTHEIDASVESKRIDADLETKRLAAEDRARDDRRELVRTVLIWLTSTLGVIGFFVIVGLCIWFEQTAWLTVFVGTVGSGVVLGLAMKYGRRIDFSAFGITAKTTDAPPEKPPEG